MKCKLALVVRALILAVANIRHKGVILAFDLVDANGKPDTELTAKLKSESFEKGLLLASCGMYGNAILIMVPLTVNDDILMKGLNIIRECLNKS